MIITNIEIYRFSIAMEPFVIATGTMDHAQNVLIKVNTDTSIYGLGECSAFPMIVGETQETCLAMARDFAKIWKGKNPLDIESRIQELHLCAAHNPTIKSAFDMALYDLSAKHANMPLYKFLRGEKKVIETDMTIGIGTPEDMAKLAVSYKDRGATMLKIKLGKSVAEDIERVSQIRRAVGDGIALRLDANQGWPFEDAIICLNSMAKYSIEFCEQPMRTWWDDKLPELIKRSPIKIMADESCYNHHDARKLINSGSCDFINIKFSKSGGINEGLKINSVAADNGISCMIGSMLESRLALSANLHFAYACPNVIFYDLDTCLLGHLQDPITNGLTYQGYFLDLPDLPGIGADVDEGFLKNCDSWIV